jgi:hypothetical protein
LLPLGVRSDGVKVRSQLLMAVTAASLTLVVAVVCTTVKIEYLNIGSAQ